jgi:hypothetical protein
MEEYEITIKHKNRYVKAKVSSRSLQATQEEKAHSYLHIDAECAAVLAVEEDCKKTIRILFAMLKEYEERSEGTQKRGQFFSASIDEVQITMGDIID